MRLYIPCENMNNKREKQKQFVLFIYEKSTKNSENKKS